MIMWTLAGLSLRFPNDGHPWPYLLWPVEVSFRNPDFVFGYYVIADSMVLTGITFLIGHAMASRKNAAFLRWVALWVSLFIVGLIIFSISAGVYAGGAKTSWWPVSIVVWGIVGYGLGWALRVVKIEQFGHCESVYCHHTAAEVNGGERDS